ncbi:MAG TPA: hypothetical protein VFJ06_05105 [Halococcus sp.]|nr:hypothetical protein [Halococcus sp.]
MLRDRHTLGTSQWTVLTLVLTLTLAGGAVVVSAPLAAAQTVGPESESIASGILPLSENMKMFVGVVAAMTLLALVELIVIARPSFRWLRVPSFSLSMPSFSASSSHEQSERREEPAEPTEPAASTNPPDSSGAGSDMESGPAEGSDGEERDVLTVHFDPETDESHAETDAKDGGSEGDVLANVRATVAAVVRRMRGQTRMVFDRRALDLRAYGTADDWTALAFDCSETDAEPVQELLEETVYIGEVPAEITENDPDDRPGRHLSSEASVRFPREGIERVEQAAQVGKPEAKRTVTLLRRTLRAYDASPTQFTRGR